jgi:hypothetical protein
MQTALKPVAVPAGLRSFDDGATARDSLCVVAPSVLAATAAKPFVAVLDADLAIRDLSRMVRYRELSGLARAARTGFLRVFATTAIRDTVLRKIDTLAPQFRWDPSDAHAVWADEYAPWVRFIDVSGLKATDRRVREVYSLDTEDGPTAQLVRLITPDVFLSCNYHHFPQYGTVAEFHGENWSIVTVAYRVKSTWDAVFTGTVYGGAVTYSVSASAIRDLASMVARMDRRILLAMGLGAGILAVVALLHPTSRRWLLARSEQMYGVANEMVQMFSPLVDQWVQLQVASAEATRVIAAAQCRLEKPRRLVDCVGTVLARADAPLSPAALGSAVAKWGYERSRAKADRYLLRVLRTNHQLFREDQRGRWTLSGSVGA